MNFTIENKTGFKMEVLMKKIGYTLFGQESAEKMNFIRPTGSGFYPRFHAYLEGRGQKIIFSLHLDQKKPVYHGATAHNADYDDLNVRQEKQRILAVLNSLE